MGGAAALAELGTRESLRQGCAPSLGGSLGPWAPVTRAHEGHGGLGPEPCSGMLAGNTWGASGFYSGVMTGRTRLERGSRPKSQDIGGVHGEGGWRVLVKANLKITCQRRKKRVSRSRSSHGSSLGPWERAGLSLGPDRLQSHCPAAEFVHQTVKNLNIR